MPAVANDPVTASSRDASPSPAWRRKFASRCGPSGVSTLSGWNCTPSSGRRVADAHDHPVDLAHGGHAQLGRERCRVHRERVIAGGHERRRHPGEQPGAIVGDLGRLAVDEGRGADDRRPEDLGHRLHPETDTEHRDRPCGRDLDRLDRDARVVGIAGSRRDDDASQMRLRGRRPGPRRRPGRSRRCG